MAGVVDDRPAKRDRDVRVRAFGRRVRSERERARRTQLQVAESAGLTHAAYSAVENGNSDPRLGTAWAIADALGMPLEELLMDAQDSSQA